MHLRIDKNEYPALDRLLQAWEAAVPKQGAELVKTAAQHMHQRVLTNLETQGRGGAGPALSEATLKIYRAAGVPDGSGIRNHLSLDYETRKGKVIAVVGIAAGQPTIVAKVQDQGAIIPVTAASRGYLSQYGIRLNKNTTHLQVPGRRFYSLALEQTRRETLVALRQFFDHLPR